MIEKKFFVLSIISMMLLVNIATTMIVKGDSVVKKSGVNSTGKQWTLMFYDDADFYRAFDPLDWFVSEAFSSGNINVLVLQDTENGPATLWYIAENHSKIPLKEMGEINMGNYTTLRDFVAYCKNNYSAQRYMVFFYDHGGGWAGACCDNASNNDWLTMDEMQHALTVTGGVDVVCFSAPCLMGAVESAYELRNCTKIYIGSEETSGYLYWGNIIGDVCGLMDEKTDISNIDLGKEIVNMIKKNLFENIFNKMYRQGLMMVTMSAIDTSKMETVALSIDQLSKGLISEVNDSRFRIKIIHDLTESFPPKFIMPKIKKTFFDVYDFSKKCYHFFFFDKEIRLGAKKVMKSIDDAVIANLKGIGHLQAHGLTIYFPSVGYYDATYTTSNLDFTNNTHWDEFLTLYLG